MKRILIFLPLVFLSACASKKTVAVKISPAISGSNLPTANAESVRYNENFKAYSIGRYIDPNDGLMMHEAHTLYRVETTTKWNLHPNFDAQASSSFSSGPAIGLIDSARQDSPVTPEIATEIERQKSATQTLLVQNQRVDQALNQLAKVLPATAQVAAENLQMKAQMQTTARRLELLEDQFRKSQDSIEFTPPATPSGKGTNGW